MKKFCETLREYVMKIINFKKKKMIPYLNQTNCRNLQQKGLEINTLLIKIVVKIGKIVIENSIDPVHNIRNLKYSITNEIPVVFHN